MLMEHMIKGKTLPQKGNLVQAISEAGPLLQTTMVGGPMMVTSDVTSGGVLSFGDVKFGSPGVNTFGTIGKRQRAAAGTTEEQAKNFQWGLRKSTLNHLMCIPFMDVAQVANAARNYEILHERDDDDAERPDKRHKSGDRQKPTTQQSSHRNHGHNNDRHGSDRRGGGDNHRSNNNYSGNNNRSSGNGHDQRNRDQQSNRPVNSGNSS
nr:zinc finger, CCHC-type, retrotransposon Gag domain protein [Tanacetum cinerariifolium]